MTALDLAKKNRWMTILGVAGTIVAILVGVKQLGLVLPTEALAKSEAYKVFETKENAQQTMSDIRESLRNIEICLRDRTCGILPTDSDPKGGSK
jgi:hypothetical protein